MEINDSGLKKLHTISFLVLFIVKELSQMTYSTHLTRVKFSTETFQSFFRINEENKSKNVLGEGL